MSNTVKIKCPEHAGKHTATLYKYGHEFAGVWSCDTSQYVTGECAHENTHVEFADTWPGSPTDLIFTLQVYVCDLCNCTVEGDPVDDKAIALAEMAQDCE